MDSMSVETLRNVQEFTGFVAEICSPDADIERFFDALRIYDMIWLQVKGPVQVYKPLLKSSSIGSKMVSLGPSIELFLRRTGIFIFIKTVILAFEH